ncbi:SWR1 complex subunit 2 [Zostera marina]|uniref:SWR1 complex subunit 2 n=1 Tax=Zostera marina TaxID=29655 RepID=A0A0K9NUI8_ZOSMR|nr:SWR1 complex subunit 2 [Zostera marina]
MEEHTEEPVLLDRSSRKTRGKRIKNLIDEEIEQDDQFWNQDALKEDEDDTNYVEEGGGADEFDSDFNEDEPDPDEGGEKDVDERVKTKKKLIFPGKSAKMKKNKKNLTKLERSSEVVKSEDPIDSEQQEVPEDLEGERVVRKSTRTSVVVRQAEREAIREALQAISKPPVKRKKEGEQKRITQEEMLLDAAQTEIMNLRNLERVLAREEEVKKKAVIHKEVYSGPQVRYSSRDGKSLIEFINGATFHSELKTTPSQYPKKEVCVVTGLPAKYRDPKTGLPYATIEAFKVIRERFLKEENDKRKPKKMNMGPLFHSLGQAFPSKQIRSGKSKILDHES